MVEREGNQNTGVEPFYQALVETMTGRLARLTREFEQVEDVNSFSAVRIMEQIEWTDLKLKQYIRRHTLGFLRRHEL
jgi:hypothetical protein